MTRQNRVVSRQPSAVSRQQTAAFTLVEMLIAMAITLVMIGAVVTLFANISNSVRNRRAVIELSGQMRHARNMLQQDLEGATCNGLVWQRPDENQGYIEIIEGPQREGQASVLVDGEVPNNTPGPNYNPEIDHQTSILPASNLPFTAEAGKERWLTDGGSLGDGDDILMLTVRNEHEPFVGRVPETEGTTLANRVRPNTSESTEFADWQSTTITSPLAEVVWFAVENPDEDTNNNAGGFFGEPGMRTIYRRTLLIAPWFNPYRFVNPTTGVFDDTFQLNGSGGPVFTAQPGLVRILPANIDRDNVDIAIACLIAFQERYDLSVRLEFDPLLDPGPPATGGRWKIVANTLGDLTKRENRYGHIGYGYSISGFARVFPFPMVSGGVNHTSANVAVETDPELTAPTPPPPDIRAILSPTDNVLSYEVRDGGSGFVVQPFLYFPEDIPNQATARAMLNDEGEIVRVVRGPVPLSGERRGEDVMLTDALGFDLRVYDPGAPLFAHRESETILEPTDPAWLNAYIHANNMDDDGSGRIGTGNSAASPVFPFVGQGAYVDLGYGYNELVQNLTPPISSPFLPTPRFATAFTSSTIPWFFTRRPLSHLNGDPLAPGYAVFDTWSFHYENNGLNEDGDITAAGADLIDEGTNGLDDLGHYFDASGAPFIETRLGPDDVGERETVPPYDKPLRGLQAVLRLYERDSRQVRQVSVNQSFVPE